MDILLSQFDTYLQSSLLASLVIAFLGGVLASLTPCVYPMIPITAGVIGHANVGGSKRRGFALSLTYVTGMALTYAALGIFAAATGRFFGSINSSPWTFLVVGNVFLLFGLGMLDVIQLPTFAGQFTKQTPGNSRYFPGRDLFCPGGRPLHHTGARLPAGLYRLFPEPDHGRVIAFCFFSGHGRAPVAGGRHLFQFSRLDSPLRGLDGED